MPLIDSYGRTIDYLRLSITDRCNFRCVYCMPEEGAPISPKSCILTFEEIERLARIAVSLGMTKLRLTGGEPLVRRDIDRLVTSIGSIEGLRDLSLTTNGFLLDRFAESFQKGGLNRVNISLDTLKPERFTRIARRGDLAGVWKGIKAALQYGLTPLKLNCVVMRGYNEDEIAEFARLTLEAPLHVRFIELMPINWSSGEDAGAGLSDFFALSALPGYTRNANVMLYAAPTSGPPSLLRERGGAEAGMLDAGQMRKAFVPASEMRDRIESEWGELSSANLQTNGPASAFRLRKPDGTPAQGTVGFISQITSDVCRNCNRLRLTADGQLRPCLMADGEADLRTPLREGASDKEIAEIFRSVVLHKPFEHRLEDGKAPQGRNMSQLGG